MTLPADIAANHAPHTTTRPRAPAAMAGEPRTADAYLAAALALSTVSQDNIKLVRHFVLGTWTPCSSSRWP